jgi:hypothetical protein
MVLMGDGQLLLPFSYQVLGDQLAEVMHARDVLVLISDTLILLKARESLSELPPVDDILPCL